MKNQIQKQATKEIRFRTILREKELWFLVLLGLLYFYRPLFMGATVYFRDLSLYFYFPKQLLMDFIHAGELPLWNIYQQGGQPYLADISNFPLYPLNVIYLLLPLLKAYNYSIVLHLTGCAASAYILARILGMKPVSSLITGLIYGFCGYTLSLGNLLGLLMAMPYLPLLVLFWHLFLCQKNKKWFVLTVVAGVLQVLAGAPETNILSMLLLLGWTLFFPYSRLILWKRCILWGMLGIFIIGIASIQILPTIEMILQSPRSQGRSYEAFSYWSLPPKFLPNLIFPDFLGNINTMYPDKRYWGLSLFAGQGPFILSIYFGGIALALAFWGGLSRKKDDTFPFKLRIFLIAVFVGVLLLSSGRFLPFFRLLYHVIPLIHVFRYPTKFLIAGILPIALLAGYASELYFSGSPPRKISYSPPVKLLTGMWSIGIILCVLSVLWMVSDDFSNHFQKLFFKQSGHDLTRHGLTLSFFHAFGIWLLFTLLYQYRRFRQRNWQPWMLVCILVLDLFAAGKHVNFYTPKDFFTVKPDIVQTLQKEIDDGRLYRAPKKPETVIKIQAPTDDLMWLHRWNLNVMNYYTAVLYRIPMIFHEDFTHLSPARFRTYRTVIESRPWEARISLLSAGAARLIITSDFLTIPGLHFLQRINNRSNIPAYLYRNEKAADRVMFVNAWQWADSDDEALHAITQTEFDPRARVVLQFPKTTLFHPLVDVQASDVPHHDSTVSACEPAYIEKRESVSHAALFSVSAPCEGYLVFSEPYYPGWKVSVDGRSTPVLRANYAFSAIFLSAGKHRIERFYRPNSLLLGVLSTFMFCCALGLLKPGFFSNPRFL